MQLNSNKTPIAHSHAHKPMHWANCVTYFLYETDSRQAYQSMGRAKKGENTNDTGDCIIGTLDAYVFISTFALTGWSNSLCYCCVCIYVCACRQCPWEWIRSTDEIRLANSCHRMHKHRSNVLLLLLLILLRRENMTTVTEIGTYYKVCVAIHIFIHPFISVHFLPFPAFPLLPPSLATNAASAVLFHHYCCFCIEPHFSFAKLYFDAFH